MSEKVMVSSIHIRMSIILGVVFFAGLSSNTVIAGAIQLQSQATGRCLNIHGGKHDHEGGPVTSYSCARTPDQRWKLIRLANGNVKLKNKRTGRCLNIHGGRHNFDGAPVTSYSCADTPDQQWEVIGAGSGDVKLKHERTGRCLNIHRGKHDYEGGPVTAYSCASTPDQQWEWSYTGGFARAFRHCSAKAKANIREAIDFMDAHKRELKKEFKLAKRKGKRRRIRRRFDRKLHKLRFSCAERVLCRAKSPRVAMHPGGIATRKVRICYDKIVSKNYDFCNFVNTVSHEFGHAIGIKKARLGRHHKKRNDRVYRFGNFAENLCREEGWNRPLE